MTDKKYDVFGVGNALVDILAQVSDDFVASFELHKGSMSLMDSEQQAGVLTKLEHESLQLASGGSAANTMVAIAQSGGTGVYVGQVAHDPHGVFYKKDMEEAGIDFPVALAPEASFPTGTSVILTTPDAERTMCTHLGISNSLKKSDVDFDLLSQSKISYVEGYLWHSDDPRSVCIETFEQSRKQGVRTSFTFSDSFLVDAFKDDFSRIVDDYCDIIFCNADEIRKFFGVEDLAECNKQLAPRIDLAFITDGPNGCYVLKDGNIEHVAGFDVKAIDTVGAGDAFAGGALFGLTNGMSEIQAARWGNYFASRVVSKIGPRLEQRHESRIGNRCFLIIPISEDVCDRQQLLLVPRLH